MNNLRTAALAILVLLLAACAGPIKGLYPPEPGEPTRQIHVINLGWHTDIALRRADISKNSWPEIQDFPDVDYLEVGWGDWDFYQAPKTRSGLALKAALLPTRSVLHVVGFNTSVQNYFPNSGIIEITLSEEGFERLSRFIAQSYAGENTDTTAPLGPGHYPNSRFYPARGTFHLFNNCNTWVARALRSAGCPITPIYAITAGNVMYQARRCGKIIRR